MVSFGFDIGSALGGLFGLGGSAFSSLMSYEAAKSLQNSAQEWQERMSNTAHQREMADLKAAGLNPLLTATGGSGASFGSVGTGTANVQDLGQHFNNMVQNSLNMKQMKLNEKKTEADVNVLNEQAELLRNQSETELVNAQLKQSQIALNILEQTHKGYENDTYFERFRNEIRKIQSDIALNTSSSARQLSEARYADERSRGYQFNANGFGFGISHTGNKGQIQDEINNFIEKYGNKKTPRLYGRIAK